MKNLKKVFLGCLLLATAFTLIACGSSANKTKEEDTKKENDIVKKFKDEGYLFSDRSYPSISSMVYSLILENPDTGIVFASYVELEKEKDELIPGNIMSIRFNDNDKDIDSETVYFQGKHSADEDDFLDAYTEALEELGLSKSDFIEFVEQYASDNYKTSEKDLEDAKSFVSDDEDDTEATEDDDDSDDSDKKETTKPDFGALSDSWDSFQIELDGEVIQLPLTYKEFETFGWTAGDRNDLEPTDKINAGDYESYFKMVKGDAEMTVKVKNFSDKAQKLEDCDITELSVDTTQVAKLGRGATLPGGIKLTGEDDGIMMDAIRAQYGESGAREVESINALLYEVGTSKEYCFYFTSYYDDALYKIDIIVDAKR